LKIRRLHSWDVSVKEAIRLQENLAKTVVKTGKVSDLRLVAGCDVSYDLSLGIVYGGVVLWNLERDEIEENHVSTMRAEFPYVPGLLGFREAPVLLHALSRLKGDPAVILVDGQGIAHPRGLGLASHLGLHLHVPTVGCAKKVLVGIHGTIGERRGDWAWLHFRGRRVGAVVRTKTAVRPLYVSPGNRISIEGAVRVVLGCMGRFRLPDPIRQAHLLVEREKRKREISDIHTPYSDSS
jgi:deoxyribonuclease V